MPPIARRMPARGFSRLDGTAPNVQAPNPASALVKNTPSSVNVKMQDAVKRRLTGLLARQRGA